MPRLLVTLFAVFAILCSGMGSAWASARMLATTPAAHAHCHEAAKASAAGDCCKSNAACEHLCNAPAALPVQAPALDDYINAHFEAVQSATAEFPAHALNRLRPPITPSS